MVDRPYTMYCDAIGTQSVEVYSLEEQRQRLMLSSDLDLKDEVREALSGIPNWLPAAAEVLNISPDIKNYILSPVISMPSDLPNRNQQAFPFTELTRWTTDRGCLMYKTWAGMPCHQEHNNKDPSIAKGIILSCLMRAIPNTAGNIWKVIKLAAIDRERDAVLANEILSQKTCSWSMGAFARDYSCSICGATLARNGCDHLEYGKPNFQEFNGKLAYYNVVDPVGFELSVVKSPAYYSAKDMATFLF